MIKGMGRVSSYPYSSIIIKRTSEKSFLIRHSCLIRQELLKVVSRACIQSPYRLAMSSEALLRFDLEANEKFRLSRRHYSGENLNLQYKYTLL